MCVFKAERSAVSTNLRVSKNSKVNEQRNHWRMISILSLFSSRLWTVRLVGWTRSSATNCLLRVLKFKNLFLTNFFQLDCVGGFVLFLGCYSEGPGVTAGFVFYSTFYNYYITSIHCVIWFFLSIQAVFSRKCDVDVADFCFVCLFFFLWLMLLFIYEYYES
jgi:hypothetical protein